MNLLVAALFVLVLAGLSALMSFKNSRLAHGFGVGGVIIACLLGCIGAVPIILGGPVELMRLPWSVPAGDFFIELDALSAFFIVPILALASLTAIYGAEYLDVWRVKRNLGVTWFFFNVLTASMVLVCLARNALLFLMAWEVMALASYFLVTFEHEQERTREAGWIYLVATHLGTAFLVVLFLLMGRQAGSLDFDRWTQFGAWAPGQAGLFFILAIIGFGSKAGFMPFHVWLPEAHPAAPSHVSALMSGVMIKTGIYGLYRLTSMLGPPPAWWGWVFIGIGLSSGLLGVLFALVQHDLKRLLAYSSVENIGIITLGMGLGFVGLSASAPALVVLGFGGSLLHVWNHALFKGLLFLGAGSVLHATGTRQIDQLGGLLKRMPWTGFTFLVGAVAICGLPPLNGFVSEFLVFFGAFSGVLRTGEATAVPTLAIMAGLALIGGLAAACFCKAFGMVFLGEPRTTLPRPAHECGPAMHWPMCLLAGGCGLLGLLAPWALRSLQPLLRDVTHLPTDLIQRHLQLAARSLSWIVVVTLVLWVLIAALAWLRHWRLSKAKIAAGLTWDCGYAQPTVRMQYSASSFVEPLSALFRPFLWTRTRAVPPKGFFPSTASLATDTADLCHANLYRPAFLRLVWGMSKLRWLQHGRVQLYVLYIALTLLLLLIWKLG